MGELIAFFKALLSEPDILLNLASLFLAIAAIVASFVVAGTQNRIALFNIRYDAYFELNCLLDFAQHLRENPPIMSKVPQPGRLQMELAAFNAEFAADLRLAIDKTQEDQAVAQVQMLMVVRSIEKTVKASQFATKDLNERELEVLMNALRRYLTQVIIGGMDYNASRDNFIASCDTFKDKHFSRAIAKTRLYKKLHLPIRRKARR